MFKNKLRTGLGIPQGPAALDTIVLEELIPLLAFSTLEMRKAGGDPGSAGKPYIIAI